MPRVHHVKKARKDNPVAKKGESYYWWKFRYGGKRYSLTYPKRSQLTSSGHLAAIYDAEDNVSNCGIDISDRDCLLASLQTYEGAVRDGADTFRNEGEEYNQSADNVEEYFPGSEKAEEIREKAYACEEAADQWEQWADELSDVHSQLCDLGDEPEDPAGFEQREEEDDDEYEARCEEYLSKYDDWHEQFTLIVSEAENLEGQYEGPQF